MCATTVTNTPCSLKTLILYGSPRKDGASAKVLTILQEQLGGDITVVDSYARHIVPCDDCRGCYTHDGCVKRDMTDIYAALEQADRLVFVTPVYNRSFPAPLKAIVDRLQCYWAKRFIRGVKPPIEKPKTALLITVCGSDRDDGEQLLYQLEPQFTILHVTDTKAIHIKGCDGDVDWDAVEKNITAIR